jgi:exosortase
MNPPGLSVWLLVVLLGYWGVLVYWLGGVWSVLAEYSYGWVVPMLCGMLLWDRWRTCPPPQPLARRQRLVWLLVVVALSFSVWRVFLEITPFWRFAMWCFAGTGVLITLLVLLWSGGFGWVRHFGFSLLFFFVAIPWPERIEWSVIGALTELNASITVELLSFVDIVAVRIGNLILIERGMVGVEEACSGIRSFQSTLMVALFLGELFRFNLWRRLVFMVAGALLAFAFNILRTFFLVWRCSVDGVESVERYHDPAGMTILAGCLVGLAWLAWRLNRGQAKPTTSARTSTTGITFGAPEAMVVLLAALLVVPHFVASYWFARHEVGRTKAVDWRLLDYRDLASVSPVPIKKAIASVLCFDEGTGWRWEDGAGNRWQAFLFEWEASRSLHRRIAAGVSAVRHLPEHCFVSAGMQMRQKLGLKLYLVNGVPMTFNAYEFIDRGQSVFVFSSIWESSVMPAAESPTFSAHPSTLGAVRASLEKVRAGERGVTGDVRVFKLGVWGPRTIGEAEVAFQQQLNQLVGPVAPGASARR